MENIHPTGPGHLGYAERGIAAIVNPDRLRRILSHMLDENEFLGPSWHSCTLQISRTSIPLSST